MAELRDVEFAMTDMLERSAEYFADLWLTRTDEERDLLIKITRDGPLPITSTVARSLRDYDVLGEDGGFAVPIVARWVKERHLQSVA